MKKVFSIFTLLCFSLIALSQTNSADVFSKKYIKSVMNKAGLWQVNHPKHAQWDWTNGAFYAGLFAAWETTKSPELYKAMMAMGNDSTQWRPKEVVPR
jgi:rhamnogalacturonyl hydrolase YesR